MIAGRKELFFWWTGFEPYERISLVEVPSTFKTTPEEEEAIKIKFAEAKQKNPHFFDGRLWRYENVFLSRTGVEMSVSPTTYMPHNVLRFEKGRLPHDYPNPISINAVQVTLDGYIPIGVKGKFSDQRGLDALGSGFSKREVDVDEKSFPPTHMFQTTSDECKTESSYGAHKFPFDIERMYALGAVRGSNTDTTICVYVPLKVEKKDVSLGNQEHSDLLFLPTDKTSLDDFLNLGELQRIKAVDHLVGDIYLFRQVRHERGLIE